MARSKGTTRRSIEVDATVFARLQVFAKSQGKTGSGVLEEIIVEVLGPPSEGEIRDFYEAQKKRKIRQTESEQSQGENELDGYIRPLQSF
jgi:hypothetical protein